MVASGFGISSGGGLWVVVLCGVWCVLCVVVARVPALRMCWVVLCGGGVGGGVGGRGGCFCGGSVGSFGGLLWWGVRPPQRGCCGGRPIVVGPCGGPVCGCSGGVLLSRSLVGAVPLALGGLASGFGMGPGVSLPRCGRRDGGGVVVRVLGRGSPPWWGGGWVGSGLRSGRGWFAWCVCRLFVCPPFLFAGSPHVGVAPCSWGLSRVLWGGCVGCVRVGRLVPVG